MATSVDLNECPGRDRIWGGRHLPLCKCGNCAACGFPKHMAVHAIPLDAPARAVPWGHEFVPAVRLMEGT